MYHYRNDPLQKCKKSVAQSAPRETATTVCLSVARCWSLVRSGSLKLIHRGLAGFNVIQQCHNQTAIQMASDLLRAGREIFFGTDHALSRLSWP